MVWAFGVALIIGGTLLIIYAMQDMWPIAPISRNNGGEPRNEGYNPGEPARAR